MIGTIRDIINSAGTILNHIEYTSLGELYSETSAAVDHIFGYAGREVDEESDLQYDNGTYVDPSTGRQASQSDQVNPYAPTIEGSVESNETGELFDPDLIAPADGPPDPSNWSGVWTREMNMLGMMARHPLATVGGWYQGIGQGWLNIGNGLTDLGADTINMGISASLPGMLAHFTHPEWIPQVPLYDWSRDWIFAGESDFSHEASKFAGGNGAAILLGLGWTRVTGWVGGLSRTSSAASQVSHSVGPTGRITGQFNFGRWQTPPPTGWRYWTQIWRPRIAHRMHPTVAQPQGHLGPTIRNAADAVLEAADLVDPVHFHELQHFLDATDYTSLYHFARHSRAPGSGVAHIIYEARAYARNAPNFREFTRGIAASIHQAGRTNLVIRDLGLLAAGAAELTVDAALLAYSNGIGTEYVDEILGQ